MARYIALMAVLTLLLFARLSLYDGWRTAVIWTAVVAGLSLLIIGLLLAAGRRPDWNNFTRYNQQRIQGMTWAVCFALVAAGAAISGSFGWAAAALVSALVGYMWARRASH